MDESRCWQPAHQEMSFRDSHPFEKSKLRKVVQRTIFDNNGFLFIRPWVSLHREDVMKYATAIVVLLEVVCPELALAQEVTEGESLTLQVVQDSG